MTQEEVQRFIRTTDALEPRRKVYRHTEDDTDYVIALVKEAILSGNSRTTDIFKHVKESRGISKSGLLTILNDELGELWDFTDGIKTTKHYYLLEQTPE
ncbi:MAG: hypothetical protein ACXW03_01640 [Methylobacter sp.]